MEMVPRRHFENFHFVERNLRDERKGSLRYKFKGRSDSIPGSWSRAVENKDSSIRNVTGD